MHGSDFTYKIENLKRRAADLQHDILQGGSPAPDVLQDTLKQLHTDLEQVHTACKDLLEHDLAQHAPTLRWFRQCEDRYRYLAEMTTDGVLVHRNEQVFFANAAAAALFGAASPQDLLGMNIVDRIHPDCRPRIQQHLDRLRSGIPLPRQEQRIVRLDGQICHVELTAAPVIFDDQPAVQYVCRDLTECRRLQQEVVNISDMERSRIGQDLHDALGQSLTGISYVGKTLEKKLQRYQIPEEKEANEICQLASQSMHQARCLARGLLLAELRAEDLAPTLKSLALDAQQIFNINCNVVLTSDRLPIDDQAATHMLHIAQEALTNAIKHGNARNVYVHLDVQPQTVSLTIRDDGIGLPTTSHSPGIGLRIMRHRANLIAGHLSIQSNPGRGTTVTCQVPAVDVQAP